MATVREIQHQLHKMVQYFNRKRISVLVALLINHFVIFSTSYAFDEKNDLAVSLGFTIEMEKKIYRAGEDLVFKFAFENLSKEIIFLGPFLYDDLEYFAKIEDEKEGIKIVPLEYAHRGIPEKQDILKLYPKAKYIAEKRLAREYDFLPVETGKYNFFVEYHQVMDDCLGVKICKGKLRSNTVRFEIVNDHRHSRGLEDTP